MTLSEFIMFPMTHGVYSYSEVMAIVAASEMLANQLAVCRAREPQPTRTLAPITKRSKRKTS